MYRCRIPALRSELYGVPRIDVGGNRARMAREAGRIGGLTMTAPGAKLKVRYPAGSHEPVENLEAGPTAGGQHSQPSGSLAGGK